MPEGKEDLRFGTIALQLGYTSSEKLNECLSVQQEIKKLGVQTQKIGEIMVDKSCLTETQVKHILRVQGLKGGHTQVAGYKIISKLGQGAMGNVYKAHQLSMDRLVAVKILSPRLAQNEQVIERFFREARAVAKLSHPNIIQGIDVGESHGLYYFAMEYIDGPTLKEVIKQSGPLEEKRGLEIMLQMARALDHAYQNNLIHRDIKPSNIMVSKDNITKLCDLGLARLADAAAEKSVNPDVTCPNDRSHSVGRASGRVALGTPAYISPEQARAETNVDIRSDIYSLGATFYHIIVGEVPFPAETAAQSIAKHLNQPPPLPRAKNPQISNKTNAIILKMMAKKREDRFQNPAELLSHLEQALTSLKQEMRQAPVPTAKVSHIQTHRFSRLKRSRGRSIRPRRPFKRH